MKLHTLKPNTGATKSTKRLGRGQGSGKGGTSTKGHKGQQAVSGYNERPAFEGGQMPIQRRIPKFGFKNINRVAYKVVNLDVIQQLLEQYPGSEVNHEFLASHGIISGSKSLIKVLGRGEITVKAEVKLNKFSQSARQAIEAAGGTATEV